MNEITAISKSLSPLSGEMTYLKLNQLEAGDRVTLIKDGMEIQVYINNELRVQGMGRVPAFLHDVNEAFGGSFLADASIVEDGSVEFTFYPRYIRFSSSPKEIEAV